MENENVLEKNICFQLELLLTYLKENQTCQVIGEGNFKINTVFFHMLHGSFLKLKILN